MGKEYRFSRTDKRTSIFERAINRIKPLISARSDSQTIDQAVKMGQKYLDRMQDAKKRQEKDRKKLEEIRDRMERRRQKWETKEIGFEDI